MEYSGLVMLQGMHSDDEFNKVLAGTRIKSETLISMLKFHLVTGVSKSMCYDDMIVKQQNFERGLASMNKAYAKMQSDVNENITSVKAA